LENAIASGLATHGPDGPELHPLVREYLFTKLHGRDDTSESVQSALNLSLNNEYWVHAFGLIERLGSCDLLDQLIERSFKPLLSLGRIATLERMAHFAHEAGSGYSPLIALIDAESAFRSSAFSRAEAV